MASAEFRVPIGFLSGLRSRARVDPTECGVRVTQPNGAWLVVRGSETGWGRGPVSGLYSVVRTNVKMVISYLL